MTTHDTFRSPTTLRVGTWAELGTDAQAVRSAVFVVEQGIPAELEWDAADAGALHVVAYVDGVPVATGRWLTSDEPGVVRVGRMAVLAPHRGGGLGRRVLDALIDAARAAGHATVMLHAQESAIGFYDRAGFEAVGPSFVEAGIVHQEMRRRI
ncbi:MULTISPECIES: GNAT family N-acetyltransferase [unclassified Rubrivivax]|uniref:GNAT family N-acetyltransferase n=1 Tax=unclassified Rubrivivax TaxID=2649762 RepID=UPI001E2B0A32|nr:MULTISPECIES: GNAT family N-acetyltransferase [unclassified Rubrivivax]MCC9597438.1 GNAT family N-acetyltransferase [Rubrivivax sp. JA1055]MCC9646304.1 GNAT family N-acetyltransferase [Rubrivivax sp. JA1029]